MIASLWVTNDDYAGVALYRLRASLYAHSVPIVPWLLHRICVVLFAIRIGMGVTIREGLYLPHGNVTIDGVGYIGKYVTIAPGVTIGVKQGSFFAPEIGNGVHIGTGAKVLGGIVIGPGVHIGANAVVIDDMPEHTLVAGIPARVIRELSEEERV
jgi:serine O-acetyltransferase